MEQNNNKLMEVQEMLFEEMKKLKDDEVIFSSNGSKEIQRSTALYNQATGYIKIVNLNIKIFEMAKRNGQRSIDITKYLGL